MHSPATLSNCLQTQVDSELIAQQQPRAVMHQNMAKTAWWSSKQMQNAEWAEKPLKGLWVLYGWRSRSVVGSLSQIADQWGFLHNHFSDLQRMVSLEKCSKKKKFLTWVKALSFKTQIWCQSETVQAEKEERRRANWNNHDVDDEQVFPSACSSFVPDISGRDGQSASTCSCLHRRRSSGVFYSSLLGRLIVFLCGWRLVTGSAPGAGIIPWGGRHRTAGQAGARYYWVK